MNEETQTPPKARYVMIGGFLGAGKTTTISKLAQMLHERGLKVGLITNDQGSELVDTAMLRSKGFATEEISGGCFCCRFNSLVDAAGKLTETDRPDVFIAEPVGSCTDLVATVSYPLRRMYGADYTIAPLSVLIDPVRAARVLGLSEGGRFSEKVRYIYRKQLEEADIIVINKIDSVTDDNVNTLSMKLMEEFPKATLFEVSAREEIGLESWFAHLWDHEQSAHDAMPVDYETYADGEALLGWLNATVQLRSESDFNANRFLKALTTVLQESLTGAEAEIAHLKMTLSPDGGLNDIAVINLVRNDFVPELSQKLEDQIQSGQLIINLRAEGDPDLLRNCLEESLSKARKEHPGVETHLDHCEHFRPGKPEPTHRLETMND